MPTNKEIKDFEEYEKEERNNYYYDIENYVNEDYKIYRGKNSPLIKCPYCKREFRSLMSSYTKYIIEHCAVDINWGDRTYYQEYESFCIKCKNKFKFTTFIGT